MTEKTTEDSKPQRTRASRDIPRPPEAAAGDIDRMFDRIRTIAAPTELTGTWAKGFGLSTDTATVLKWLGVVRDGAVDQSKWDEIRVPATREAALDGLVRAAYAPIFEQVDVAEATKDDLAGAFITKYKMGDPVRYVRAFVTLCGHAGIKVGAEKSDSGSDPAQAQPPKMTKAPARQPQATRVVKSDRAAPPKPVNEQRPTATITVNVEIPAGWTEEQIKERLETVKRAVSESER